MRVAIVVPGIFAFFFNGVDNPVAALFAAFGSFALLGFADFGGSPRQRSSAYLVLTGLGAALVVLGTVVSNEPILAALIGVLVATAMRFAGCFGNYYAASVSPVILAYVLAASVPAPVDSIPDRVLGWVVAGLVATVAALVLWPRRERMLIREAAATAASALADGVDSLANAAGPSAEVTVRMDTAVDRLVQAASVPRRPAGPSAHDESLAFLIDELQRIRLLMKDRPRMGMGSEQSAHLLPIVATALREVQVTLTSGVASDDLDRLVGACVDAKLAVVASAETELGRGRDSGEVLDEIDGLFTERLLLFVAASALANATILVSGHGPSAAAIATPLETPLLSDARGDFDRLRLLVRANAKTTSAWAQESLRAGIAVGAAILIAGVLNLDHGFWVVLGTLSVLRSNAFATGRTALMASVGTAVGFAASALLLAIVGFDTPGLWVIVVAGFFLSAYTPQVVGFVAGQVSFTIAVVALFNLIEPQGWQTGLVRLENIAIGSGVSAVVALLFWPSRAATGLRRNLAGMFRDLGDALLEGFEHPETAGKVRGAELRSHASYVQYLSEMARTPDVQDPWATLLAEAAQVRFGIGALQRHPGITRFDICGPTRSALHAAATDIAGTLGATADRLEHPDAAAGTPIDVAAMRVATRAPVCTCLEHHAHEEGPDGKLAAGLDAALLRGVLVELAAVADDALAAAPTARP
jgi:uncharacterized membrane protein YccC